MQTRTFVIGRHQAGRTLAETLVAQLRIPRDDAVEAVKRGRVRLGGNACTDPARRVRSGQRLHVQVMTGPPPKRKPKPAPKPPPPVPAVARDIVVRFADEHVVVVEKPPGLTTVRHADEVAALGERARKFLPPTLVDLLPAVLGPRRGKGRLRAVHRLDKETSGLVVLARTAAAEAHLGKQFRAHTTGRTYLALVRGQAQDARIESHLVRDRGDARRGSGPAGEGQRAVTHVRVVEPLGDFTLVECTLETGRTHQVRIHLGEAGTPLCGERVYDRPLNGQPLPDASGAARPMLHAASLSFEHPATGQRIEWRSPPPEDWKALVQRLRGRQTAEKDH